MAITDAQFANVVKEQTAKATLLTPIFLAQFASSFDGNPNNANPLSSDVGEQIVAAASNGVFWQGSYASGKRMVKQNGVWVVDGEALARALADAAKDAAVSAAEALVQAGNLGQKFKGPVDAIIEENTPIDGSVIPAGRAAGDDVLLVGQTDGIENGSYRIVDGAPWTRLANFDIDAEVSGATWYDRGTKSLQAVTNDAPATVGTTALVISPASSPIEVKSGTATDVVNGQVNVRLTEVSDALEFGGSAPIDGEQIKVTYTGPLLGTNSGPLVDILTKIEKNQRRETRPLAFTLVAATLAAAATTVDVSAAQIPTGFIHDSSKVASAHIFGARQLKPSEFTFSITGQAVTLTLSAELVTQLKDESINYEGEVLLPIIPA